MPDVLIFGDTFRTPELRNELPVHIHYAGLYVERAGKRLAFFDWLEMPSFEQVEGVEAYALQEYGFDDVVQREGQDAAMASVIVRICAELGLKNAIVPRRFPLELADALRASGVTLAVDPRHFDRRRRSKNAAQISGVRRAQRAAEDAMAAIQKALRSGVYSTDELRTIATHALTDGGSRAEVMVISHGLQTADPLDFGSGAIEAGEPILVDLFPRDMESWCFADMTRTFCVGEPPQRLVDLYAVCDEARKHTIAAVRAGVTTGELAVIGCDVLRQHGYRTFLDTEPGETLEEGAVHVLGHGVGLEMIEEPQIWLDSSELVVGDVFSVEPGLYFPGWGGCRIEDLVLVTEDGAEVLTDYPYTLEL